MGHKLSHRQAQGWRTWSDGHTDRRMQATTIPKGQNWPQVKIVNASRAVKSKSKSQYNTSSSCLQVLTRCSRGEVCPRGNSHQIYCRALQFWPEGKGLNVLRVTQLHPVTSVIIQEFRSIRLCAIIWHHRTGSTLVQVMAWCLTAPSHNLNQCWLFCWLDPHKHISVKLYSNIQPSKWNKIYWKCCLQNASHFCSGLHASISCPGSLTIWSQIQNPPSLSQCVIFNNNATHNTMSSATTNSCSMDETTVDMNDMKI